MNNLIMGIILIVIGLVFIMFGNDRLDLIRTRADIQFLRQRNVNSGYQIKQQFTPLSTRLILVTGPKNMESPFTQNQEGDLPQ